MKTLITLLKSNRALRKLSAGLTITTTIAILALLAGNLPTAARAEAGGQQKDNVQTAELLQLLSDFHGALSYGGNITAMMSLWTDDGSITFNGTPHVGKSAVQSFFQNGGYFLNHWVSLAPEYKTQITIHGDTAEFSTQCVAIDLNSTPMVVKGVIQVTGFAVKTNGQWMFQSMNNTAPAPL